MRVMLLNLNTYIRGMLGRKYLISSEIVGMSVG